MISGVHGTIHPSATTILRALRLPSEDSGLDFAGAEGQRREGRSDGAVRFRLQCDRL